jgi:hypothetical protein
VGWVFGIGHGRQLVALTRPDEREGHPFTLEFADPRLRGGITCGTTDQEDLEIQTGRAGGRSRR